MFNILTPKTFSTSKTTPSSSSMGSPMKDGPTASRQTGYIQHGSMPVPLPIRITILRITLGNAGAVTDPGNAQRVSPETSDRCTGPRITLRIGGTTPTSPPAIVGPKTTGQVPRQ